MRLVDLDDAAGLEAAWVELERRWAVQRSDPALREAILRRIATLDTSSADVILAVIDELEPAALVDAFFDVLAPDRPALGAYRAGR